MAAVVTGAAAVLNMLHDLCHDNRDTGQEEEEEEEFKDGEKEEKEKKEIETPPRTNTDPNRSYSRLAFSGMKTESRNFAFYFHIKTLEIDNSKLNFILDCLIECYGRVPLKFLLRIKRDSKRKKVKRIDVKRKFSLKQSVSKR
ncbi:hypothetical protein V1478_018557 [Vespula squamosa]|uniref:Uncharacterized protein n=1 Tax=Vespula squamosa TaxID=30214 RepID=A0ABD1ZT41_VESSQ